MVSSLRGCPSSCRDLEGLVLPSEYTAAPRPLQVVAQVPLAQAEGPAASSAQGTVSPYAPGCLVL